MKATCAIAVALMSLSMAVAAVPAAAGVLATLTDENSTVSIELRGDEIATDVYEPALGMHDWVVDGVRQLKRQWFWGRAGGDESESPLDSLTLDYEAVFDTDGDGDDDTLSARYSDDDSVEVEIRFTLVGGQDGSYWSDIVEQVRVENKSTADDLEISLFQYVDFDLMDTPDDDRVDIMGPPGEPGRNTAYHDDTALNVETDTVIGPAADRWQADEAADLLALLTDGDADDLDLTDAAGPGTDVAFAFQWDFLIPPEQAVIISKDKLITPEPATIGLLAFGGVAAMLSRCRRRG